MAVIRIAQGNARRADALHRERRSVAASPAANNVCVPKCWLGQDSPKTALDRCPDSLRTLTLLWPRSTARLPASVPSPPAADACSL